MAEFSKQYCDSTNHGFSPDFDILEIAEKVKPGFCLSQICEGYGFIAVGKDEESNVILAFRTEENTIEWKQYLEVIK
jgi:hypothetical protein